MAEAAGADRVVVAYARERRRGVELFENGELELGLERLIVGSVLSHLEQVAAHARRCNREREPGEEQEDAWAARALCRLRAEQAVDGLQRQRSRQRSHEALQ